MQGAREVIRLSNGATYIERQVLALESSIDQNPSLAFDLSKSLIESVCKTILIDRSQPINDDFDLPQLFKMTINCLRLLPDNKTIDANLRSSLLKTNSGLSTTIQGLCELRNNEGFASHGKDGYFQMLEPIQARLAAQAADSIVYFLYSVHKGYTYVPNSSRLRYEDNQSFNEFIDETHELINIFEYTFVPSDVLFNVDMEAYKDKLSIYNQESDSGE